jgi:hypothetical protein
LFISNINLIKYCKEKDLEACAVKIHIQSCIISITIYKSPSGNFLYFLKNLASILNSIHSYSIELVICGDLQINYLNYNYKEQLLNSMLASLCLHRTVQFPTRILYNLSTATDNIHNDKLKNDNFIPAHIA